MKKAPIVAVVLGAALLLSGCGSSSEEAASPSASASATSAEPQTLLTAQSTTVLDQAFTYPRNKPAQVSSSIVTLLPGQETGMHKHEAPMYAYVLEGTVTVEYKGGTIKEYPAGTAIMEAIGTWHNGKNLGDVPVRILVVNMGAKGVKNTVAKP